jgi:hypothetical protein
MAESGLPAQVLTPRLETHGPRSLSLGLGQIAAKLTSSGSCGHRMCAEGEQMSVRYGQSA